MQRGLVKVKKIFVRKERLLTERGLSGQPRKLVKNNIRCVPGNKMEITEVRLLKVDSNTSLRAFASVCFNNEFIVYGFKVIEKSDGLCVSMPERKVVNNDGSYEFTDLAYPTCPRLRKNIITAIMQEYIVGGNMSSEDGQSVKECEKSNPV